MVYEGIYLYILVYTQIYLFSDNICMDMMYIPQMFSFSAWTGTYPLASPVFHCQSFLNCTRRQLISWTFYSATCPTRPAKRPSGISKRPTAYYTRSARLCCGAIRITARAKPQRYHHVFTGIYTYIIVYTCIYRYIPEISSDMHVLTSMPTSRISRRWPT